MIKKKRNSPIPDSHELDKQILLIPLDTRPVCYQQVKQLAAIAEIQPILPPEDLLGNMKTPAPKDSLLSWFQETIRTFSDAALVLSLDTLAYGGLIAGRVNTDTPEALKAKVQKFLDVTVLGQQPISAFTSILRIPNYNGAEEEPDYWATHGKALYEISFQTHKTGIAIQALNAKRSSPVPAHVLDDFLKRRETHHTLNQWFLEQLGRGQFSRLVFCQDDTGEFGLNVKEAQELKKSITKNGFQDEASLQTGADEVALTQLARLVLSGESPKVFVLYEPKTSAKVMAKFDGQPIEDVVAHQLKAVGVQTVNSPDEADIILLVNGPETDMGDHCERDIKTRSMEVLGQTVKDIQEYAQTGKLAIVDVLHANGGDPQLFNALLVAKVPLGNLLGYAGWNTPGNTIGTGVAMAAISWWAKRHRQFDKKAHEKLLATRLLDDWVYQANVRSKLRQSDSFPSKNNLQKSMQSGLKQVRTLLGQPYLNPQFSFPCNRFFEIQVDV